MAEDDRYLTAWGGLEAGLPLLAAHPELGDLDDGYGLRHLVAHLALAGRTADVHRLLACERPPSGGRLGRVNVWYDACERAGRIDGYLDDLASATELARAATDAAVAAGRPAPSFGLELRYALMAAAVRSTAERTYAYSALYRHDHAVAPMLVESGLWDVTRALSIARRIGDRGERTEAVRALLPYAPAAARQDVLSELVIGSLGSWEAKELLPSLSAETMERVLERVEREHADGFPDPPFDQLAAHLPAELLPRALAIAAGLEDGFYRRTALQALVPLLPPDLAAEALASARDLTDPAYRAQTLLELVPRLPRAAQPGVLADAYAAISRIDTTDEARLWALGGLIALLPVADPSALDRAPRLVDRAMAFDALPADPWDRAEALTYAARLVSAAERDALVAPALAAARLIADPLVRARMLMEIAELVPLDEQAGLLGESYEAACAVTDPSSRGWVLTELADAQPAPGRTPAITAALAAADAIPAGEEPGDRVRLLLAIADVMAPPERDQVLARTLDAARAEPDEDLRYTLLLEAAELLTGTDRHAALAEAVELALDHIGHESYFSSLLGTLCPVLPDDLMTRVLTELVDDAGPGHLGRVLVREARHFTGEAHRVALAAARDLDERPWYKTAALAALADDRLPAGERAEILEEAIATARRDGRGLPQIARRLPAERRTALLAEELALPRRVFNDRRDAALAALPDTTAPPVPFERVTIEHSRWLRDDELYEQLLRAQRSHREGESPAVVIRAIRDGLPHLCDLHNPGSTALTSAARTFGGPEAEREYRAAVHDVYRWWADPRADPRAGPPATPPAAPSAGSK